jgi:transposase-like protein
MPTNDQLSELVAAERAKQREGSFSAPRLASATARRHGISNQLVFAWRKAYREGRLGGIAGFVPAEGRGRGLWSDRDCERERPARYY